MSKAPTHLRRCFRVLDAIPAAAICLDLAADVPTPRLGVEVEQAAELDGRDWSVSEVLSEVDKLAENGAESGAVELLAQLWRALGLGKGWIHSQLGIECTACSAPPVRR